MSNFLPYAIIAGIVIVFFVVCYVMYSGGNTDVEEESMPIKEYKHTEKEEKQHKSHQAVKDDTSPLPKISTVTVREREENPSETAFVTTKGEAVRRNGKIVYEAAQTKAQETAQDMDNTRVLSRSEILAAMDKVDKEEAAANKAKTEEAKKEQQRRTAAQQESKLTDMASIVAADLAKKEAQQQAAAVSSETQIISPALIRKKQEELARAASETKKAEAPLDQTQRMEAIHVASTDKSAKTAKSPWGNDLAAKGTAANQERRQSIWDEADEAEAPSPVVLQWADHFLKTLGMVTPTMKKEIEYITAAAFRRIGCQTDEQRQSAMSGLLAQEALLNLQKVYASHPQRHVAALALQAFEDIVKGSPVSTRHLIAVDALKVMPYLLPGHYKILSMLLLFLYSRNAQNVDKESFGEYMERFVVPFLDEFPTERSYYHQLDYLRCTVIESKETHFAEILADSYSLLFRYRGFTEEELRKALKGKRIPSEYIVPSFNSPLCKLAMVDESMAPRFFRLTGIQDRALQDQLMRLAKKRPASFSGEEALDIMEDISPVLADLGDIWDSTMLRISTLSLLGLYLAQGYIKEQIGEDFDLSRWFE